MRTDTIIDLVRRQLHDPKGERWTDQHMADFLSAALRQVVLVRPSSNARTVNLDLVSGTLQSIPEDGLSAIDVPRNIRADGSPGAPITRTDRESLDTALDDWHGDEPEDSVDHWVWDDRRPREFYVTPPVEGGTKVELVYARAPDQVAVPGEGEDWPDMEIDPVYSGPVGEWMLYLSYMVDTGEGSQAKAGHHYQSFYQALGEKARADALIGPMPLSRREARE